MIPPLYLSDSSRRELSTRVTGGGKEADRPYALLAETLFYPEGGGQPCDLGTLGPARVLEVLEVAGEVRHYLDREVLLGPVVLHLDWQRRLDHMQQHTAQHLLTALAQDRHGWATTAFHLGPRVSDVELAVPALTEAQVTALEDALAEEIRGARRISARYAEADEYAGLSVRTRGLPEGFSGVIRLVEIEGLDLNTCGGTHLAHTGEIGTIALLGTESARGGTRLTFVAGDRVHRRLRQAQARHRGLRAALGVADEELVAAAVERMGQIKEGARRLRGLTAQLATAEAVRLAAQADTVVGGYYPERDAAFLQTLGGALTKRAPGKVALLTAGVGEEGRFLLLTGAEGPADLGPAGVHVAQALAGRGGGKGRRYQGQVAAPERLETVLDRVRSLLE